MCDRFEGLMKSHSIQPVNISMLKQLIEESVRHHEQMCKVEFVVQGYSGCPPSEGGREGGFGNNNYSKNRGLSRKKNSSERDR